MWKDYSSGYIKNNRASGVSVMVAAFISALLLSILCSMFYNLWFYEVENVRQKEGDWQGRITGISSLEDMALIQEDANVEQAVINEELSDHGELVADIYFKNIRSVLTDMPQIAKRLGLSEEAVTYNYMLLNLYLIRDPEDPAPRLLFPFFLLVVVTACLSLILIIHNSFAVSMNARIHQFGILSSIGATPRQIRSCLLQEAFVLCAGPVAAGSLLGIVTSMGILRGMDRMLENVEGRMEVPFQYHPLILLCSLLAAVLTIWLSAWIPAKRMSRLTPLEAIKNTSELQLKRKRSSRILPLLFGIEGELAGNALKAQKKALRTASYSLTLSFLAFTLMICFFSLSRISQRMTYFERYQDVWDIMITVKDTEIDEFLENGSLSEIPGVRSEAIYQKAKARRLIASDEISKELRAFEILETASEQYVSVRGDGWMINVPLIILDDAGFLAYCEQIKAPKQLDGAVILNRIPDVTDSDFRNREFLPYLEEDSQTTILRPAGQEDMVIELPVLAYTREVPVLREEYSTVDHYELVHVIPVSVWKEIKGQIAETEENVYIRILAEEGISLAELEEMEEAAAQILDGRYETEIENRIQDKRNNDAMYDGMMLILGGFCVLLAMIGIGNVFCNTLGFVRQRKREFARYLSVGLTLEGIRKMFLIEALVIAGRPVLITLPVAVAAVGAMLRLSYLKPVVFLREAPVLPILAFLLLIFSSVTLAYYLGGRKVLRNNLMDALRDDTVI